MPCKSVVVCGKPLKFTASEKTYLDMQTKKKTQKKNHSQNNKMITKFTFDEEENCSTVFLCSTVGSDAMHHYKPGTAIGST